MSITCVSDKSFDELLSYICSLELDVDLNITSGYTSYFQAVSKDATIGSLLEMAQTFEIIKEIICNNIVELSQLEFDTRYSNPNDTAMAVLLWILWNTDVVIAYDAATYVKKSPQCWYARKIADNILNFNE